MEICLWSPRLINLPLPKSIKLLHFSPMLRRKTTFTDTNMRYPILSILLACSASSVIAAPQGKGRGNAKSGGGPTGLGALLGPGAGPGAGCAKLEVLIGES
jgi:hypothetical protein